MCAVARYTDEQVERLLQLYRRLFANTERGTWDQVAGYWDFGRSRQWSCLTTNFRAVTLNQIYDFDGARRRWRPSGNRQEDGQALAGLARDHRCGYSLGISPWTDSGLYATVTQATKALIVLVGHDWYPIVPRQGPVEARPPLDIFPLLDSTDPQWSAYADGLPKAEAFRRAGVGLLFLNLVPDFRPPDTSAEGPFPFHDPAAFGYPHCAAGLREALKLALTSLPILHVVTWGGRVWEALRCFAADNDARTLAVIEAASRGGAEGFRWALGQHTLHIHPFPHPLPSKRHLLWKTPGLFQAYCDMWNRFLRSNDDSLATSHGPAIPPEVQQFAVEKGVSRYLTPVIELARQAFPSSALSVSLGQDAEDERHRYIALDVEVGGQATKQLLAGQHTWSAGISRVCPSRHAVYFVLGWR